MHICMFIFECVCIYTVNPHYTRTFPAEVEQSVLASALIMQTSVFLRSI